MKIVYRAGNITEAEIVKGMLVSNDIEAHVSGYYLQGGIGELAPTDLAKVHVEDADFENARKLIKEYEGSRSAQPEGDLDDETEQSTEGPKFLVTIFIVIVVAILSYWIGI